MTCQFVGSTTINRQAFNTMIQVEEMTTDEAEELIARVGYGHLGCSLRDVPYIVPIHYAYAKPFVYIYTTEGHKYEIIRENPNVCLQVEDVHDNTDWKSVMIIGFAHKVTDAMERKKARTMIAKNNPSLTPAISIRWMDNWVRENREVVFRIEPVSITGRYSIKINTRAAFARPGGPYTKIY